MRHVHLFSVPVTDAESSLLFSLPIPSPFLFTILLLPLVLVRFLFDLIVNKPSIPVLF